MISAESARVYLSLGSNIAPLANLSRALALLAAGSHLLAFSQAYRTPPQGFTEQEDFYNAAALIQTPLTPLALKHELLARIEARLGRARDPHNKNAPRTIDLDIALWGDQVFEYGEKPRRVPDPDILHFAHVAVPLAELAPELRHPVTGQSLAEIAAGFAVHFERTPLRLPDRQEDAL